MPRSAEYKVEVTGKDDEQLFTHTYTNKNVAIEVARALTALAPEGAGVSCEKVAVNTSVDF